MQIFGGKFKHLPLLPRALEKTNFVVCSEALPVF